MTSACIFKDTLRNHTQVFLKFRDSILGVCSHLINLNCTLHFLHSMMLSSGAGTSNEIRLQESEFALPAILIILPIFIYWNQLLHCYYAWKSYSIYSSSFDMSSNISLDSINSDVFYVEQISNEPSPQRSNSLDILNSTELSEHHAARMPSISTIASPQPYIFTFDDDSNEPTILNGFVRQLPIVPPSLKDLNLPPIPFNILATMAIATNTGEANDDNYSPQSPEPSDPSPISTPPMNVSAYNNRETSYTTTDNDTFYSSDEPDGYIFFLQALHRHRHRPENWREDWAWECPFQKRGECRSTSAKPAVRWSPQQRTPQVHRTEIKTVKTFKLTHELWIHSPKHFIQHLLINLY